MSESGFRDGSTVVDQGRADTQADTGQRPATTGASGPARSRRRPPWVTAVVLVLVLGLLGAIIGVADTAARRHAESQVAGRMQTELQLTTSPEVRIGGVLFLGQFLQQRLGQIHVTADAAAVDVEGGRVELEQIDLWLHDVTSDDWFNSVTVGRLEGTGRATWPSVTTLVGQEISYSGRDDQGRGRVAITQRLQFQGLDLPITLTGRPTIDEQSGKLELVEPSVAVSGVTLPADLVADLVTSRLKPIDLPMPAGLRVSDVSAEPDGLVLTLHGSQVAL